MSSGLNKNKLINELTVIFTPDASEKAESLTPKQAAEKMATAIENYVKSGKVETSVIVNLTGQTFGTSVGPATAVPGSIASGDGIGEIK
mgnify:CR=1 FL=1|tara:strand:- start:1 stop:267 length:267 start_codon:yes stop_codon:yes gene_type:complete